MKATVSHDDPLSIVARKYVLPFWVFIREFRDGTGFSANTSADALAFGLYHSRGQILIGFEQKISRADWLKELKNPDKAEHIAQFCDHWNVVVSELGIVEDIELPPNWGLLLTRGRRVKVLKQAPKLNPKPVHRGFMAALVKRAIDDATAPYQISKEEAKADELQREFERGRLSAGTELSRAADVQRELAVFEEASGIHIGQWSHGKEMGRAVDAILRIPETVRAAATNAEQSAKELERAAVLMRERAKSLRDIDRICRRADI